MGLKRNLSYNLIYSLILATFATTLSACGNNASSTQSIFTPVRPDPTATATLSLAPSKATPTSVVSDLVAINNYTHASTRFSINYPENWQFFERPNGAIFIDPGDQAGYSVFFSDVGQPYSERELNQYLVAFVAQNFVKKDSDFSAISQEAMADGSIVAQFTGLDPNLGPAINEIRVSQKKTIVFVLLMSATQEQWGISHNKLQGLADSFVVLDTTPVQNVEPTEEAPVWDLIGPTSNEFGFLRPSNWDVLRQDDSGVLVTMPDAEYSFEATVSAWTGPTTGFDAASAVASDYVSNLNERYENVKTLPPAEFLLSGSTAATIDFLYTREDNVEMAGSVITTVENGKVYRIVFSAPAELYDGALQWFNPMLQNFAILAPEEIIINE